MPWYYSWDVGKVKSPKELRKFLLNEFIHPDMAAHMKIIVHPAKMEIFYDDSLILRFVSDYYMPWRFKNSDGSNGPEEALDLDTFIKSFKKYYQKKHNITALNKEDYYFRILALLDKRTGKRTLKKFLDNGDFFEVVVINRDFRLEALYRIRFKLANIHI